MHCPCPGKRLLGQSSPEVQPSFTAYPAVSARSFSTTSTSPGVSAPATYEKKESTSHALQRELPGFYRASADKSHLASYGAAPRFSQPPSDFFLSPPSHHFQMGNALGVLPFRGLLLPRSPHGSSPQACLPDVCPASWPTPVLGGGARRRVWPCLGFTGRHLFFRLQGFSPRKSRSASPGHLLCLGDRPAPLGLSPPHGIHSCSQAKDNLSTHHAS